MILFKNKDGVACSCGSKDFELLEQSGPDHLYYEAHVKCAQCGKKYHFIKKWDMPVEVREEN